MQSVIVMLRNVIGLSVATLSARDICAYEPCKWQNQANRLILTYTIHRQSNVQ